MNEALLHGPIAPRLVRLALPILVVLAVQTLVGVAETYFVGYLGTAALTGVALVFPLLMLMTTRLLVATAGGWYWVMELHGSIAGLYWFIAASLCLFGAMNAIAFVTGLSWGRRVASGSSGKWNRQRVPQAPAVS